MQKRADKGKPTGEGTEDHRTTVISSQIFENLRLAIIQQNLRPGHFLSEWDIARQFNVSRQPVREAFIRLGDIGLVEIRPRRGTFVRLISLRELSTARFLRETIEASFARIAAKRATAQDIADLAAVLADHRILAQKDDYVGLLEHDEKFHRTLARIAGREDAWPIINKLKAPVDRARFLTVPNAASVHDIINQHEQIMLAIEEGDPDKAEAALLTHLHEIDNYLPSLQNQYPYLFTE
ncbi:MAG: GntR family transcriptional regulator [Methylobacteriaceae bacterium]|jgi:DNA-binding GntR family transcriptional regulator|nr:GntR family transcriptional regulator [Methylobacteriaceae bacterium]